MFHDLCLSRPLTRRTDAGFLVTAISEARERKCSSNVIAKAEACLNAALAEARLLGAITVCKVGFFAVGRAHGLLFAVCCCSVGFCAPSCCGALLVCVSPCDISVDCRMSQLPRMPLTGT